MEPHTAKTKRVLTLLPFRIQAYYADIKNFCQNITEPSGNMSKKELKLFKESLQRQLDAMDRPVDEESGLWHLPPVDRNKVIIFLKIILQCMRDNLEAMNKREFDLRVSCPQFTAPSGRQVSLQEAQAIVASCEDDDAVDHNNNDTVDHEEWTKRKVEELLKKLNKGYLLYRSGEREELLKELEEKPSSG
ncbi:hypothetical protein EG329_003361 [Mollisiaceae sp. DMI_Dod_QoI]|nr:hypothetical protein EG329_003361 [Helotiales sp. DMI_Dod_QoI]